MPSDVAKRVGGHPTKKFFIDFLTRDIGLAECILDLVDNSLHSLIEKNDFDASRVLMDPMSPDAPEVELEGTIEVVMQEDQLTIQDSCGGLPRQDATDHAFRFGGTEPGTTRTGLGVYGVGMKRAFFKLGKEIHFYSRPEGEEPYEVPIDVDEWRRSDKWDFRLRDTSAELNQPGTKIVIRRLNSGVGKRLATDAFQAEVLRRTGLTYGLFIRSGVEITVNANQAEARLPAIAQSGQLTPARNQFSEGRVDVLLIAGVSPKADKTPGGWYVFCNGRLVVDADKTELTGWGEGMLPAFHSKFNHFVGYAYFRSKALEELPWTTTKRGINKESRIYRKALSEMQVMARPVLNFLTNMYPSDVEPEGRPEREALNEAKSVPVDKLEKKKAPFEAKPKRKPRPKTVSVQFRRPVEDIEKIRKRLSKKHMSAKAAGAYCMDYFLKRECR